MNDISLDAVRLHEKSITRPLPWEERIRRKQEEEEIRRELRRRYPYRDAENEFLTWDEYCYFHSYKGKSFIPPSHIIEMKEAKKCYIYLFRHGQTTYNRDSRFTGLHNPSLTLLGKKQARILAKKLQSKKFQVAYHTSLKRSKQTLNIVLKTHKECLEIKNDNRMIERNYGALNGTTHEDLIKKSGINFYNQIHRRFAIRPPQGESFADVEKRVKSFIEDLIHMMKKKKVNVAISAHGNSIRLFRKIMEHASIKATCSWTIPYDKVFTYPVDANSRTL